MYSLEVPRPCGPHGLVKFGRLPLVSKGCEMTVSISRKCNASWLYSSVSYLDSRDHIGLHIDCESDETRVKSSSHGLSFILGFPWTFDIPSKLPTACKLHLTLRFDEEWFPAVHSHSVGHDSFAFF